MDNSSDQGPGLNNIPNPSELMRARHPDLFSDIHAEAAKFFSEHGVAELAAIVINMNVWTRLKLAQGAMPKLE